MIAYFGTSALLKKYFEEAGSDFVVALFKEKNLIPFTSVITQIESYHCIFRKKSESRLPEKMTRKILRQFDHDMQNFKIVQFGDKIIRDSQKLIRQHVLKTLDAIHIASALQLKRNPKIPIHFVSSDSAQSKFAQKKDLTVLNPLERVR